MAKVRGKYRMVMVWYRSGNEKESRKKHAEGRRKIGYSSDKTKCILRISYVYGTYILRISYVIDKGKARGIKNYELRIMS